MKPLRRFVFAFVLLATLAALFYAEEDWRGARELARVKTQLRAQGETLELAELIPSIPDSENVAQAPLFVDLREKAQAKSKDGWKDARLAALAVSIPPNSGLGFRDDINLVAWQKALTGKNDPATAARDVLQVLNKNEPLLAELGEALSRPHYVWPLNMRNPIATQRPDFQIAILIARHLSVKAGAEIAVGDGEAAKQDLFLMTRLSSTITENGFLTDYLVGVAIDQFAFKTLRQGLVRHVWNAEQVKALRQGFEGIDEATLLRRTFRMERALGASAFTAFGHHGGLYPAGWFKLLTVSSALRMQHCFIDELPEPNGIFDVKKFQSARQEEIKEIGAINRVPVLNRLARLLSSLSLEPLDRMLNRAADVQNCLETAQTACALEEYRLARGSLPDSLDELVPAILPSLPLDPVTGHSLIYKRESGDGYLLYSPGWNLKDDGGVVGRKDGKDDPESGDWVWASRPDLYRFTE